MQCKELGKMKSLFLRSVMSAALLPAFVGSGSAQAVSNDLLQTGSGSGSREDLSSLGLGTVTFQGVPLSTDTGPADTIVQHMPIPANGGTVSIQVVALHLQNTGTVTCENQGKCGSYFGKSVEVHATINLASATGGNISLPQPDALDPSAGSMTVPSTTAPTNMSTFDSSFTNIEADIIVVAPGAGVNGTRIFSAKGPAASMSANGGTLSATAPANYPSSKNFPTVAPYVLQLAGGTAAFLTGPTGRIFRGSLWGLASLLMVFSLWTVRTAFMGGRLDWRPAYLAALALATGFAAWRIPGYPVVHAASSVIAQCRPPSPEQGTLIQHGAAPASTACPAPVNSITPSPN
jgi:hypothetical protein